MENVGKKPKDKFETFLKFTALGLAGAVISSSFLFKDDIVNTYEKNKLFSGVVTTLKEEIKNGVGVLGNKAISIKTGVEYQNEKNVWGSFATTDEIDNGLCTLMLTAGGNLNNIIKLNNLFGVTQETLDKVNSMISSVDDSKKIIEMVGYHELYHCDEEVIGRPRFNLVGFDELNSSLNALYAGGSLSYPKAMMLSENSKDTLLMNGNLDNLLSEGYAEAASSIVMARNYGDDAIPILAHRQASSGLNRVSLMNDNPNVVMRHTSDAINNYYMSSEGIEEAKSLKTVNQVRERSWEHANVNLLKALKSRENIAELLNDKYWNKETLEAWRNQVIQEKKDLPDSMTPLVKKRVAELKSKLPEDLINEFVKVTLADNKNSNNQTTINAYVTYKRILTDFPKLETGAEQIKIIQRDLPIAVNSVEKSPVYELKTSEEVFESANSFKDEKIKINKDLIDNNKVVDNHNVIEVKSKMKI